MVGFSKLRTFGLRVKAAAVKVPLPVLKALLIAAHKAIAIGLLVRSVGEQREESTGCAASVEVRALRVVVLPSAAIVGACVQAVSVALFVSVGAVPISAIIRGIVNAGVFVDAIPISIAIPITISVAVSVTVTMTLAFSIPVAVAISVPGNVRLTNQDPISFAVLIQASTTIVAVATRIPRAAITGAIPGLTVTVFVTTSLSTAVTAATTAAPAATTVRATAAAATAAASAAGTTSTRATAAARTAATARITATTSTTAATLPAPAASILCDRS